MNKKKDIRIEALRFKLFRVEQGLTQKELAMILGTRQSLADIERGRIRLTGSVIEGLVRHFNINPSWLFGYSEEKYIRETRESTLPAIITTDQSGKENIMLVSSKAYAGYSENIHNTEWFSNLPTFSLPIKKFKNTLLRCFQIEGDSMKGVFEPGEYAICQPVESIEDIQTNKIYIVVTKDSLVCKRLQYDKGFNMISLISVNPDYPIQHIEREELIELWEVVGKISPDITMYFPERRQEDMVIELQQLRNEISEMLSNYKK